MTTKKRKVAPKKKGPRSDGDGMQELVAGLVPHVVHCGNCKRAVMVLYHPDEDRGLTRHMSAEEFTRLAAQVNLLVKALGLSAPVMDAMRKIAPEEVANIERLVAERVRAAMATKPGGGEVVQ